MASPRPLSLSKLLDERSLPTGLIRSADTLPAVVDPECGARLHTGVETFDQLLSGGLREGSFAELAGPLSSGITACAQALAACATRNAFAAWVDLADALDPAAAHASGIELERLLWVRAPAPQTALRACERLLLSRAFALVVLDFFAAPEAGTRTRARRARGRPSRSAPPVSAWFRLQRSAAQARCSLLLLSPEPLAGAVPALTVLAQPSESYFTGAPLSDSERLATDALGPDDPTPRNPSPGNASPEAGSRECSRALSWCAIAIDPANKTPRSPSLPTPRSPPMRVACLLVLDLPAAAALRTRPELRGAPLVVVSDPSPGAAVLSLTPEASARGIAPGCTLSSARALCAGLRSQVSSLVAERAARDALRDVALSTSPRVRDAEPLSGLAAREAAVFLDASGVRSLFRSEAGLAAALAERARRTGLPASIGIGSSQGLAHLAARAAALDAGAGAVSIVAAGGEARFLASLAVDTVHPSDGLSALLTRFGIHRLGALLALPRRALATRLGPEAVQLVRTLRGEGREPALRAPAVRRLEEAIDCEAPLDRVEACLFVFRGLISRLLERLILRGFACPSLSIVMRLEGGGHEHRELSLAAPTTDLRVLLRRIRVALESAPPSAAIEHLSVATQGVNPRRDQLDLFRPASPAPAAIDALLAELESLCGEGRVGCPAAANDHRPGRFEITPFAMRDADGRDPAQRGTREQEWLPLSIRTMRPPLPARVRLRSGLPCAVESALGSSEIVRCAGPWRTTGSWWSRRERFAFDHFDVATDAGLLLRLRYDHLGRCWQIDGVYD